MANFVILDHTASHEQAVLGLHFLTLCMLSNFSCFKCCLLIIFKIDFFKKIHSGTLIESESQTVWIQIRTDVLSVLIWVQTVCKGYNCCLLIFSKLTFSKNSFRNIIIRVSNSLNPGQDRHSVCPDLGTNCLQ